MKFFIVSGEKTELITFRIEAENEKQARAIFEQEHKVKPSSSYEAIYSEKYGDWLPANRDSILWKIAESEYREKHVLNLKEDIKYVIKAAYAYAYGSTSFNGKTNDFKREDRELIDRVYRVSTLFE